MIPRIEAKLNTQLPKSIEPLRQQRIFSRSANEKPEPRASLLAGLFRRPMNKQHWKAWTKSEGQ
jgi:hypothetical protein